MKTKILLLLCLVTLTNMGAKAQDIREITVEKPGKFIKQVKKDMNSITKLKLSGTVNEHDLSILEQMPNLVYVDCRDLTFEPVKNGNLDYMGRGATLKLDMILKRDEHNTIVYAPASQKSRFDAIDSYTAKLYMPLGMKSFAKCDTIVINGVLDNVDDYDAIYERQKLSADVLIFEKKEYADKLNIYDLTGVNMIKILENNWTYLRRWEKSRKITTEELRQIDAFGKNPFRSNSLPRKIILGDNVKELPVSCFKNYTGQEIILNEGLKTIESYALPRLEYLKVPSTVEKFEPALIETVEVTTTTPPAWLKNWSSHTVIVPDGCLSKYEDFTPHNYNKYIEKSKAK